MRKVTTWSPDTHPGHEIDYEWDSDSSEDDRVHTAVRVRYPDGTTHHGDAAREHYEKIHHEHVLKNTTIALIEQHAPHAMKKPELDSDGDPTGRLVLKDKHAPKWIHSGDGQYAFHVPGLLQEHHDDLHQKVVEHSGGRASLMREN